MVHERSEATSGQQRVRSTDVVFNVPGFTYVGDWSLRMHRFVCAIKSSMILPLEFSVSSPHSGLWALKSPSKIWGVGNWAYKFKSCSILKGVPGGKYNEHIVIGRYVVTLTATACRVVFNFRCLWRTFFFMKIDVPPAATKFSLCMWWYGVYPESLCSLEDNFVSCKQTTLGSRESIKGFNPGP